MVQFSEPEPRYLFNLLEVLYNNNNNNNNNNSNNNNDNDNNDNDNDNDNNNNNRKIIIADANQMYCKRLFCLLLSHIHVRTRYARGLEVASRYRLTLRRTVSDYNWIVPAYDMDMSKGVVQKSDVSSHM